MCHQYIHKPFLTKGSTPCGLFERCWKCMWSWGGAGGQFGFLGITIKNLSWSSLFSTLIEISKIDIFLMEVYYRNSCAFWQHLQEEPPQTGMVCARPRTGQLYSGWFKSHRTSLLPIYRYPSVKWEVCIEPKACWRNISLSAAVWQETQKYPELHHQTAWQLCSPGWETRPLYSKMKKK